MATNTVKCADCGAACVSDGCGTGYGQDAKGRKSCYDCCARREREAMIRTGRGCLYLTHPAPKSMDGHSGELTDWPGRLRFGCRVRKGAHNIARTRYDVWFKGPDGAEWWGVQYGENTQICRVRRLGPCPVASLSRADDAQAATHA